MQSVRDLVRLGLGGLFLETAVYREQRNAEDRLRRGFLLVALIGLLVGFATMIGQIGATLLTPNFDTAVRILYDGLVAMPWYEQVRRVDPAFPGQFQQSFDQTVQALRFLSGGGILGGVIGFVVTPFFYLLIWLLFGFLAHLMARLLGGSGTLTQTLGCTALASSANLLGLVQIVPFAQVAGTTLLGLIAGYVAIREAHQLAPWRAFWATLLGPLLLVLLFTCALCVLFFVTVNAAGPRSGGL